MLSSPSNSMTNNSYSNDRGSSFEAEYAVDPASGGFFHSDFKKHDDLKEMLDSNKDSLKLEAMKRIIGMVAKGRDASVLFPAVVKNVVSKNIEVKKLVYVYLERYAEEQQDLALLSISTFQRALKEPNQLIRAGALRVLSSIRVKMISPIVMLAIKDASSDMSPYVRKTAAHAIPKLNSLDPDMKPELITIIQKLLADKTVLVIGSAVMAFTEVCPERVDLIHQVFRKLCALLVDVDEWGQVTIVNMLTRYARNQFADPNLQENNDSDKEFYDSNSEASENHIPSLDPDHRLLLRSTRPLLQSRNAAVVMSVAQLYHHASPRSESILAAKSLVRFLRSHVEVQSIVLNAIASMSVTNKGMFEPYLKSFFVRISDPTNVKLLKLEILTNVTNVSNVSIILRELQTYISNSDKNFVAATIQAIGRCACSISEITDSCLNGLVSLLSNRDEAVVAESVIVIKRLLQTQAADPKEIITHMARLLDSITVAQARAAILWLLGEHSQKVPQVAPDVLRKMAKTFPDEDDIVKLQIMNLAIKLYITNPEQTSLLCQYVCNLAKYDQNYDIRDKARLFKQFVPNQDGKIKTYALKIFLAQKPAPDLNIQLNGHEELQLGSLSHYIKQRANGYEDLPPFPSNPPTGEVRNVDQLSGEEGKVNKNMDKKRKEEFNAESGMWGMWESEASSGGNSSDYGSSTSSSSESDNDLNEDESSEEESSEEDNSKKESARSSEETESSSEESSSEDEPTAKSTKPHNETPSSTNHTNTETVINNKKSNLDLLLDLDDIDNPAPVMTPSLGGFFTPSTPLDIHASIQIVQPVFTNTKPIELLNRINGKGLSATFRFTRTPHLYSPSMTNINILFANNSGEDIDDIRIGKKNLAFGMNMHDFACISKLPPNCSLPATLGIDFNDTTQPANFEIMSSLGKFNVSLKPNIGELLRPAIMNTALFLQNQTKLRGMTEHSKAIPNRVPDIEEKIKESTNLGPCDRSDPKYYRFGGQTMTSSSLVLVSIDCDEESTNVTVNCENIVFGSVMLNELITKLSL